MLIYILADSNIWKYWSLVYFCHLNSHVCGQENSFQNQLTKYIRVNNHWTSTLSIAQEKLSEVRIILLMLKQHKATSLYEDTELRT